MYQDRLATTAKALAALIGAAGCIAAVAYAANTPPAPKAGGPSPRLPQPRIVKHPAKASLSSVVAFTYATRLEGPSFQCGLDGSAWKRCAARAVYRGLDAGPHSFRVRVEAGDGSRSRPARFDWVRTQPKAFAITPETADLSKLYPGAPPVALPLRLSNPNPAPILVTALRVSVTADPPGCPSASNLELIPASASPAKPVRIPAAGSVKLPSAEAVPPALALRDLPVDQDACQGAQFPLTFSGKAHG